MVGAPESLGNVVWILSSYVHSLNLSYIIKERIEWILGLSSGLYHSFKE